VSVDRILPGVFYVRSPPWDDDQVKFSFAEDLVGNVHISALCVPRLGVRQWARQYGRIEI